MKPLVHATLVLGATLAAPALADPPAAAAVETHKEATVSVEARTEASVPGSSEGATKSVPIPATCSYVRHSLELLAREPPTPASHRSDGNTSYSDELRRDKNGRITAVAVTVQANVSESRQPASIGVRLSVVMRCE